MQVLSTPRNFVSGPTPQEKLKVVKDGLDVIHDIYRYAQIGFQAIPEDDFDRFKWYGVYRQRPKDSGYFMLRTKIPGGQLNSAQLAVMGGIADDFGHGFGDITTRQTFQFHWLRIEDFPEVFERLSHVGITTSGACGDDTRNVVGCPVAGIDRNEIIDGTSLLHDVSRHMTDNREFSDLPRKYKISLCGCRIHCAQPDINCVGVFGLERVKEGKLEAGYGIKVGGGLSSSPHLAQALPVFLTPEDVLPMVHYTSVLFRDQGYRHARNRARFKFLVAAMVKAGGTESVLKRIEELAGRAFQRHDEFVFPEDPETDHLGVHEQKQTGLWYIGVCFAGGRTSGKELTTIAALAKKYAQPGLDRITTTNKQNLILLNIPEKNLAALQADLDAHGFSWKPTNFRQGCVSCTGMEFCNLALAETKNRMVLLVEQLETECAGYKEKIRIHFSGCPSSCGQHQIADIGFRGGSTRVNGVPTECFDMFVGGKLGAGARFNELVKSKVLATDIHRTVGKLLDYYLAQRQPNEPFHAFAGRTPKEQIKAALAA